jgi:hypothetical protein
VSSVYSHGVGSYGALTPKVFLSRGAFLGPGVAGITATGPSHSAGPDHGLADISYVIADGARGDQ